MKLNTKLAMTSLLILITGNAFALTCQVSKQVDSSKNGVISIKEKEQTLTLKCDRAMPAANSDFSQVKDFTTKCFFRFQSSGRDILQYPGFDKRDHSHSGVDASGTLTGEVVPLSKCIESSYGLCKASAPAPELGFKVRLTQDGAKGFTGIFISTNKTKDLAQRKIESISSSLSPIKTTLHEGIERLEEGSDLIQRNLKTLRGKNTSLTLLLKEMNRKISSGKCKF